MALSFKDLCRVLDCKQSASLKRILKARGIRWIPDRRGRPTTSEAEYDRAIVAPERALTFTKPPQREPRLRLPGVDYPMSPGELRWQARRERLAREKKKQGD